MEAGGIFQVDIDTGMEKLAKARPIEGEEPFDNDDRMRFDVLRARDAGVLGEVVMGNFDGVALAELPAVREKEFVVDGGRFIEVHFRARFHRQVREVVVVAID